MDWAKTRDLAARAVRLAEQEKRGREGETRHARQVSRGQRRGPAPSAGSLRVLARRLGVSHETLRRAERAVAAVEAYPALERLAPGMAVRVAEALAEVPEAVRKEALHRIASGEWDGHGPIRQDVVLSSREETERRETVRRVALGLCRAAELPRLDSTAARWRSAHPAGGSEGEEPEAVRAAAAEMLLEGESIRTVCEILGVARSEVAAWPEVAAVRDWLRRGPSRPDRRAVGDRPLMMLTGVRPGNEALVHLIRAWEGCAVKWDRSSAAGTELDPALVARAVRAIDAALSYLRTTREALLQRSEAAPAGGDARRTG